MLFLMMYWNPPREIFTLPILNYPIAWYGFLFALGFAGGYYIFLAFLKRYLFQFPRFLPSDLIHPDALEPSLENKTVIEYVFGKGKKKTIDSLNQTLENPEAFSFLKKYASSESVRKGEKILTMKYINHPERMATRILLEDIFASALIPHVRKLNRIMERFTFHVVIAAVLGARLGHFFFYENPTDYLLKPWILLQVWNGGLASHGAAIGIMIAIYFFSRSVKKMAPLSWLTLLDLIAIPTVFAGACIRIGNFFNQEILGKITSLPWAVVFGNPMDGSVPAARHPVQLYESLAYLLIFAILAFLGSRSSILLKKGKLIGLFFIFVFSARILLEYVKVEQSEFFHASFFTMGQILSLPFVFLGVFFLFREKLFSEKEKYSPFPST